MHTDWSVECGADDPVVVVPWSAPPDTVAFIDLRTDPGAVDTIPEAEAHPSLMQALRTLNAGRSPVFTAKCDAWPLGAEELAQPRLDLGLDWSGEDAGDDSARSEADTLRYGFASYIDCICRDRSLFASFPRHEHLLRRVTRLAAQLDHRHAVMECLLRPAFLHIDIPQQGYAISVYVKALGKSPHNAQITWSAALGAVAALIRRRETFR